VKRSIIIVTITLCLVFIGWRFLRPLQIFLVAPAFERPIDTSSAPAMFPTLRAKECAACHRDIYDEWATTIHSQAWTDPYFQVDWKFDGSPQICKNCHIPLDRQQEQKVIGFNDTEKWDPILTPNPAFDAVLQHEGVTCAACHLRNGKILGVLGTTNSPHPVEKLENANQICVTCHVVSGKRWDTFFKIPPCGTVAEIKSNRGGHFVETVAEMSIDDIASLGCVDCHMPLVQRALIPGGPIRAVRQHLWRGGHDPEMVKQGLTITLDQADVEEKDSKIFVLGITNTGAAHYIPTGTPDRYLSVQLRILDPEGAIISEQIHTLKRTVMWRPFIVELWDTRLPRGEQREYSIKINKNKGAAYIEAQVDYHLLDESRRQRIDYQNAEPIHYRVFQQRIPLTTLQHKRRGASN
jgi:hypothetical protein